MALAIKIENLSKYYRLGVINNGVLWQDLQSYFARLFGREDPNLKIGQGAVYDKKGFWALSGIDLEIERGDRIGIMGKNGAGKSTLLRILSRITAPTGGCFHVKGRIASLLEVGTGFHRELTGRENIYMNGAILGMKRREVTRKLEEIIAFSEIERHIDTPVKRYSSGMYVRLGFSIAAHLESEILIADEVLAVGDAAFREKALNKMSDLSARQGRTVLFVSHSTDQLIKLCNKGLILEYGRIRVDMCPMEEAAARYQEMLEAAMSAAKAAGA
jgi:lipopolysaccharide transport system ATP-binding protein